MVKEGGSCKGIVGPSGFLCGRGVMFVDFRARETGRPPNGARSTTHDLRPTATALQNDENLARGREDSRRSR